MSASPAMEMVEDENPNPWQTVERKSRRRASLESLANLRKAGKEVEFLSQRSPVVTAEQDTAIKAAERQLTDTEKEKIRKRTLTTRVKVESDQSSVSVNSGPEASVVSPAIPSGEGTSQQKGKGFDPCNWGNAGIEPEELDPEAQREQFQLCNAVRDVVDRVETVPDTPSNGAIHELLDSRGVNDNKTGNSTHHNDPFLKPTEP
ncbi:hypothetical protein B0H10DRAFT_2244648 [Mycena sp. CBHHK59/15]|nr:hypothetical protein B0H10DRAFT_2244648 [Mycena sp. CBHHK59/15]